MAVRHCPAPFKIGSEAASVQFFLLSRLKAIKVTQSSSTGAEPEKQNMSDQTNQKTKTSTKIGRFEKK